MFFIQNLKLKKSFSLKPRILNDCPLSLIAKQGLGKTQPLERNQ